MGRTRTIDEGAILAEARRIFLEKGYSAQTSEIAKAVGISEGSLFKRFPTKASLFHAALGPSQAHIQGEFRDCLAHEDLKEGIARVGIRIVELFRELLPRMMMLWAHQGSNTTVADFMRMPETGEPMPLYLLRSLTAELERIQRQEKMRNIDPEVLARMLLGASHNFAFLEIVGASERQPFALNSFMRGVVDITFHGLAPKESSDA